MKAGEGKIMTTVRYEIESDQEWRMEWRRGGGDTERTCQRIE